MCQDTTCKCKSPALLTRQPTIIRLRALGLLSHPINRQRICDIFAELAINRFIDGVVGY